MLVSFSLFVIARFHLSFACLFCEALIYFPNALATTDSLKLKPHFATTCEEIYVPRDFQQFVCPRVIFTKQPNPTQADPTWSRKNPLSESFVNDNLVLAARSSALKKLHRWISLGCVSAFVKEQQKFPWKS